MKNPFQDFRSVPYQKREIPLDRIVREKEETLELLVQGYLQLVEEEVRDLVWLVEESKVEKAYNAAIKRIDGSQYDADDIDEFCALLDSSNKLPYLISGPAGIYISALVNRAQEDHIVLSPKDYERSFHFLGYKLPEGKTLVLQGDVGDFTGSGLFGGSLIVEGIGRELVRRRDDEGRDKGHPQYGPEHGGVDAWRGNPRGRHHSERGDQVLREHGLSGSVRGQDLSEGKASGTPGPRKGRIEGQS